jgi:nucleoredoxin
MAEFLEIFGDELLCKQGPVSTSEALAGKGGVLVYFSAHWCPPCRGFTPKLAEFHTKHAAAKGFATVFVSGDRGQQSFDDYYADMPWLALPFGKSEVNAELNRKYKVQGIPSLVVLGPDGKLITKEGRSKVMEHFDDCAGFPWVPKTLKELLSGSFLRKDGAEVGAESLEGKTLGLYFSAHWCPPCRGFTPQLKKFYEERKASDPNFEIIFVSSDKDEQGMLDYFKADHGDYLALPFAKRAEKKELSDMFGVEGIPTFVVVGADGQTLNANARGKVVGGASSVLAGGWEPPAVGDMAEGPEAAGTDINETATVVVMCAGASADEQKAIEKALEPLAKSYIAEARKAGDTPKYIFLLAKSSGGATEQLEMLTTKDAGDAIAAAGDRPVALLFDIPDNGGFYLSGSHEITGESVAAFLKAKEDGKLTRLQLGRD